MRLKPGRRCCSTRANMQTVANCDAFLGAHQSSWLAGGKTPGAGESAARETLCEGAFRTTHGPLPQFRICSLEKEPLNVVRFQQQLTELSFSLTLIDAAASLPTG
eukprot:6136176-Pleurochrysis_carterae.AAC.1